MKSTNSMGRDGFERVMKDRFEGAKLQPSEGLWGGIETAIANHEAARYRRGMAYYRWVAAAGVILVAGFLGYLSYQKLWNQDVVDGKGLTDQNTSSTIPQNESSEPSIQGDKFQTDQPGQESKAATSTNESDQLTKAQTPSINQDPGATATNQDRGVNSSINQDLGAPALAQEQEKSERSPISPLSENSAIAASPEITRSVTAVNQLDRLPLAAAVAINEEVLLIESSEPVLPESLYGVVVYPAEKKTEKAELWAGLQMAPGYFNPNYSQQTGQASIPNSVGGGYSNTALREDHRTGFSMAFGVEMGMKLSDRWQVSSGLQYLNNNVQSSTNLVFNNRTPVFSSTVESLDFAGNFQNNLSYQTKELNSTFQFLSIPVQAGYLLLDSRLKLQVNAGIASDFFLKNRISAADRSLESVTINPGSEAPFRSVYFNGLVGAQASYEFLPRYLITLEPRYKLALSEFTKPDVSYSSLPSSFGIGVGVKYVFK